MVVLSATAANVLAFGYAATNPTFTGDDWSVCWPYCADGAYDMAIRQGRWAACLIWLILGDLAFMPFFTAALGSALMIWGATMLSRALLGRLNLLFVVLATVSPFLMEQYSFEMTHVTIPTGFLLMALGLERLNRPDRRSHALAVVCFALTFAIYQSLASLIPVGFFLLVARISVADKSPLHSPKTGHLLLRYLGAGGSSVILYVVSVKTSWLLLGSGPTVIPHYSLVANYVGSLEGLFWQFVQILALVKRFLVYGNGYYPIHLKALIWILLGILLFAVASKAGISAGRKVLFAGFLFLSLCSVWILLLVRDEPSIRYLGLTSLGIWVAGLAGLADGMAPQCIRVRLAWPVSILLSVGFIAQHNMAFFNKSNQNRRDTLLANRMLDRIQTHPRYERLTEDGEELSVLFLGQLETQNEGPFGPDRTTGGTVTKKLGSNTLRNGVFDRRFAPGAGGAVLRLVDSSVRYVVLPRLTPGEKLELEAACNSMAPWPNEASVRLVDGRFLVKLGEPFVPVTRTIDQNSIILEVSPRPDWTDCEIREVLPPGLKPVRIDQSGATWHPRERELRWGPFADASPRTFTYEVRGTGTLSGNISWQDGRSLETKGDAFVGSREGGPRRTASRHKRGDFDGDGRRDILLERGVQDANLLYVYLMHGQSILSEGVMARILQHESLVGLGDFNGDGRDDLLLMKAAGDRQKLSILLMEGCRVMSRTTGYGVDAAVSVAGTGDFDGDGKQEVLLRDEARTPETLEIFGLDRGTMASKGILRWIDADSRIEALADFNGDGQTDLFIRNRNQLPHLLIVCLTTDNSITEEKTMRRLGEEWHIEGVGDFDGDGRDDILARNETASPTLLYQYQMEGAEIRTEGILRRLSSDWDTVALADFDGDGRDDILFRNRSEDPHLLYVYQMNGKSIESEGIVRRISADWQIETVADFSGDSKTDILLRNSSTSPNILYLYQMNGKAIASEGIVRRISSAWGLAGTD
jgi:hypothetical protein